MLNRLPRSLQPIAAPLLVLMLGMAVGFMFQPGEWYAGLTKPPLTPPNWVFPVAWSTLYLLMGLAAWRAWDRAADQPDLRRRAMKWFVIQLLINLTWTPIVFGMHQLAWGFWWIFLLVFLLVATMRLFKKIDRVAVILLLPYLWWILFACYLNGMLWVQNQGA